MTRNTRKRKKQPSDISAAHFVGYVEDEESVEAIMKKFEELDKLQLEVDPQMNNQSRVDLTQEELEELFVRTSSFTVQSSQMGTEEWDPAIIEQDEEE